MGVGEGLEVGFREGFLGGLVPQLAEPAVPHWASQGPSQRRKASALAQVQLGLCAPLPGIGI